MGLFDPPYDAPHYVRGPFGAHWCGPEKFEAWEWTHCATYTAEPDGDGQTVAVDVSMAPAAFYRLRVLPGKNSVGEQMGAWALSTGSGEAATAALIAEKIASGMLGLVGRKE